MSQARHQDGPYDDGWYGDDEDASPSLGVWPLGRTYVHSSDGALNTGPASGGADGRYDGNGSGNGSLAHRDHIAVPPFTGQNGQNSQNGQRPAPHRDGRPDPAPAYDPPPSGRPPLYQVGGRYRGDEWPTDPGFRRGDLGLDANDEPGTGTVAYGGGSDFGGAGYGQFDEPRREEAWHAPDRGPRDHGGRGDPRRTEAYQLDPGTWDSGAWDARDVYGDDPPPRQTRDRGDYGDYRERPPARAYDADEAERDLPPRPSQRDQREYPEYRDQRGERPARRQAPAEHPREQPRRPEADERPRRIRPARDGERPQPSAGTERGWTRGITPAARIAAVEDAKLLAALQAIIERIRRIPSLYPRLLFLVVGYAAITCLAAAYAEKIPLPITASLIVIPAAGIIFNMGMRYPAWGRRALVGWISGIVATIIYDCLRLALVKVGIWGDPIPGIGRLVFSDPHANFAWGYLWRFMGNGGGMGIAYTMLPWRGWKTGVAYGTLICTGLIGLLYFFPVAQVHFFPLTPVTAIGGYAGHWVYGAVLGGLTSWWLPPVQLGRIHGRLTARLRHPGHRPRPTHARASGTSAAEERFRRAVDRRTA
jgi:hypothetical protein